MFIKFRSHYLENVRMIRYEMVLGIDLIDCLASYDEGLSGDI